MTPRRLPRRSWCISAAFDSKPPGSPGGAAGAGSWSKPIGDEKKDPFTGHIGGCLFVDDVYLPHDANDYAIAEIRTLCKVATDHRLGQDHHNRPAV